jgi:hypothetical protein
MDQTKAFDHQSQVSKSNVHITVLLWAEESIVNFGARAGAPKYIPSMFVYPILFEVLKADDLTWEYYFFFMQAKKWKPTYVHVMDACKILRI